MEHPACRDSKTSRSLRAAVACAAAIVVACAVRGTAAELDSVIARGELVWAADQEGGGPHVYPDAERGGHLAGFEVELADLLAEEIGRKHGCTIRARFQQGQWDRLPLLLGRSADCVINGIELTPERQRDYRCSRAYYAYSLQLLVGRDSPIQSLDDLGRPGPHGDWRVGVLTGSAAEIAIRRRQGLAVECIGYDGTIDAMEQVAGGVLDATVQDDCIATFYADRFAGLRPAGRPFDGGFYTILTARDTPRLAEAIDEAISSLLADGRLKRLYDRWDMAGRQQELLLRNAGEIRPAPRPTLAEVLASTLPMLLKSAGMTVLLSCLSMPLAIAIGLSIAVGRLYGPRWLRPGLVVFVEIVRGTPLMLQLYAIFFLLPKVGLALPAIVAAVAGLAVNYSAYESEIYRAGLKAVPVGQLEAALSLGMTKWQALSRVVVPQAVRLVLPPVTSDFIALFKDTSVCSVITVMELTKRYSVLALTTGRIVELAALTAVLYLLMSWPLSILSRRFEHGREAAP